MTQFEDIPGALAQISTFMMMAAVKAPEARAALAAAVAAVSPVDRIVQFGRAVHDNRAELDPEARAIGAAALAFAAQYGWHGMASEAPAMIAELQAAGQALGQEAG